MKKVILMLFAIGLLVACQSETLQFPVEKGINEEMVRGSGCDPHAWGEIFSEEGTCWQTNECGQTRYPPCPPFADPKFDEAKQAFKDYLKDRSIPVVVEDVRSYQEYVTYLFYSNMKEMVSEDLIVIFTETNYPILAKKSSDIEQVIKDYLSDTGGNRIACEYVCSPNPCPEGTCCMAWYDNRTRGCYYACWNIQE